MRSLAVARFLRIAAAVSTFLLALAARAQVEIGAELSIGGGQDNGLFRLAREAPPESTGISTLDFFWETRPRLDLKIEPSLRQQIGVTYQAVFRDFAESANKTGRGHLLAGVWSIDLTRTLALHASASTAREAFSAVDAGYVMRAIGVGPRWRPTREFELGVDFEGQDLSSPALTGASRGAGVDGRLGLGAMTIGLWGRVSGWRTDNSDMREQRSGGLMFGVDVAPLHMTAGAAWGDASGGSRWWAWSGTGEFDLNDHWTTALRYQGAFESYPGEDLPLIAHNLGVAIRYRWESVPRGLTALLRHVKDATPFESQTGRGFALMVKTAPSVRKVAVAGDFNGWSATSTPLTWAAPGVWQARLDLEAGRYAYQIVVDGTLKTPSGASAYQSDGLGGRNAVLMTNGSGGQETVTCEP